MKKVLLFLLCVTMALSLIACDGRTSIPVPHTDDSATTDSNDGNTPTGNKKPVASDPADEEGWLNVATYNIVRCEDQSDPEKKTNPDNIVNLIAENDLDIVGLNEVDVNNARSMGSPMSAYYADGSHQPRYIANQLTEQTGTQYYWAFAAGLDGYHTPAHTELGNAQYGNAIISKYPIVSTRQIYVAAHTVDPNDPRTQVTSEQYERRVILFAELDIDGQTVTVIVTHFGLRAPERELALEKLESELRVIDTPLIFMGDLNCSQGTQVILKLNLLLKPTSTASKPATYISGTRIDYIFTDGQTVTKDLKALTVRYSDHYPVLVKVKFPKVSS